MRQLWHLWTLTWLVTWWYWYDYRSTFILHFYVFTFHRV